MIKKLIFAIGFLSFLYLNLLCVEHISGDLIVKLNENISAEQIENFVIRYKDYELSQVSVLSKRFKIFLFKFNNKLIDDVEFLNIIKKDYDVHLAQFNHLIEKREFIPDDTHFNRQWSLKNIGQNIGGYGAIPGADIKATYAWEQIINQNMRNEREIVVAVVDDGFALPHPDINWWKNIHEIA